MLKFQVSISYVRFLAVGVLLFSFNILVLMLLYFRRVVSLVPFCFLLFSASLSCFWICFECMIMISSVAGILF